MSKGNAYFQVLGTLGKVQPEGLTASQIQESLVKEFNQKRAVGTILITLRRLEEKGLISFKENHDPDKINVRKYYINPEDTGTGKSIKHERETVVFIGTLAHS